MEQRLFELNGQGGRAGDKVTGRSGFTLAEVMVVVALIGFIATMAIPAYLKMLPHLRLKSAARDVVSAMQLARATAISKNMKTRVVINPGTTTLRIDLNTTGSTWDPATNVSVNSNEWSDVIIYSETTSRLGGSFNLTGNLVEFNPDGTTGIPVAHADECVFLVNKSKSTDAGSERYRVRIVGNTGMMYTEKWNTTTNVWEAA